MKICYDKKIGTSTCRCRKRARCSGKSRKKGGVGKERQKRSTSAAVMRATSMRDGAFSRRLMVGCEQRSRPLSGARPEASLNRGSVRRVSQSSASSQGTGFAGPKTGSTAGNRQHAEAQHGGERVDDLCRVASIADAACQRVGEAEAALRLAQQDEAAVRGDQAAIEGGAHLLAAPAGRSKGSRVSSVMAGVALSLPGKNDASTTNFYSMATAYAMPTTPKSDTP